MNRTGRGIARRDNQAAVTRTFRQFDQQYAIILKLMASAFVKNIGPFPDGSPSRETGVGGSVEKESERKRERETGTHVHRYTRESQRER